VNRRHLDLLIGILVGIALGLAVVSAFVFLGSEGSIDAPRISGVDTGKPGLQTEAEPGTEAAEAQP
jgi:hypothetical protein